MLSEKEKVMSEAEQLPLHNFPDHAIRQLLEDHSNLQELLGRIIPRIAAHLDFPRMQPLPRTFWREDWRGRESDLLFRIPYRSGEGEHEVLVVILLEHQSAADPRMPLRILAYAVGYWERQWRDWEQQASGQSLRLTPIVPVIFHTGSAEWGPRHRHLRELFDAPEELLAFVPDWQPLLWELAGQDPQSLLASAAAWLQALAVVRQEQADLPSFQHTLEQVIPHLLQLRQDQRVRGQELLWFVLSWVLRRRPRSERGSLEQALLAGIQEPTLRQEFQAMSETIEQTWEQWVQQRIAESQQQAEARGQLLTLRSTLLDLVQERFGLVPEELRQRVNVCEEAERLRTAIRQVWQVPDINQLLR
jgi:hypothetical protein